MRKSEWRIRELVNGEWAVESRSYLPYVKEKYPNSTDAHVEQEWWNWQTHKTYKSAVKQANYLEAKETFEGRILYPPIHDAKPFWKFW